MFKNNFTQALTITFLTALANIAHMTPSLASHHFEENEAQRALKARLYSKKYQFSEPNLMVDDLVNAYTTGKLDKKSVNKLSLLALLETEANKNNVYACEKLYYLMSLTDNTKANALLDRGIENKQLWAIKKKIFLLEHKKILNEKSIPFNIMAMHLEPTNEIWAKKLCKYMKGIIISISPTATRNQIRQLFKEKYNLRYWMTLEAPWNNCGSCVTHSILQLKNAAGENTKEDFQLIKVLLTHAARLGDIAAEVELGHLELSDNPEKALKHFEIAADKGYEKAIQYAINATEQSNNSRATLKYCTLLAERGDDTAMNQAGSLEQEGFDGHPKNLLRAMAFFEESAKGDDVLAIFNLGNIENIEFEGHTRNPQRALALFTRAANKGHINSMVNAGTAECEKYEGHPENLSKALEWYKRAGDKENGRALCGAGKLENTAFEGHPSNPHEALRYYTLSIAAGYDNIKDNPAFAAALLEDSIFEGHPQNPQKAYDLYMQAVAVGNPSAMHNAAILEQNGFPGHPKNTQKAYDLYMQAVAGGNPSSAHNAAILEENGFPGHSRNPENALKLFLLSADEGNVDSMFNAAILLKKDFNEPDQASYWFKMAADNGNVNALTHLGLISYSRGNLKEAYGYLKESVEKRETIDENSCLALYNLGVLENHEFEGHPANRRKTFELVTLAAEHGADCGVTSPMTALATMYLYLGDYKRASYWYLKAQMNGSGQEFTALLDNLEHTSDDQICEVLCKQETVETQIAPQASPIIDEISEEEIVDEREVKEVEEVVSMNEELQKELASYPDFSSYAKNKQDASFLREQLLQMKAIMPAKFLAEKLSVNSQDIWNRLNAPKGVVEIADLISLCGDSAFSGKLSYIRTTDGITFEARNGTVGTVGTHKKHNLSYKGIDRKFKKNFREMLQIVFGLQ